MSQATEIKFNFKSRKITDDAGNEIGRTKKQPSLTVSLPVPTADEIVSYLTSTDESHSKVRAMLVEAVGDLVRVQAKSQLDEVIDGFTSEEQTIAADALDFDKLSLEYIANLEPAARGSRAISDEDWELLFADYLQVMVQVTGKPEAKIKNHLELFKKPARAKQNKPALAILVDQLDVYMASTASLEDTGEAVSRLHSKFTKWLAEDDKFDASAL